MYVSGSETALLRAYTLEGMWAYRVGPVLLDTVVKCDDFRTLFVAGRRRVEENVGGGGSVGEDVGEMSGARSASSRESRSRWLMEGSTRTPLVWPDSMSLLVSTYFIIVDHFNRTV